MPSGCCASTWSGATARRARQSASSPPARRAPPSTSSASTRAIRSSPSPRPSAGGTRWAATWGSSPWRWPGWTSARWCRGCGTCGIPSSPPPAEENPALRYACLRRLLLEHGYRLEMLSIFRTPAGLLRQVVDSALRRERGQGGHRPLPGGGLQLGGSPLHRPVHPGGQSHPFRDLRGGARPRRVGAPAPRGQEGLLRLPDGQGLLGHQQHRPPGHHAGPTATGASPA